MTDREIEKWITVNGHHVPIYRDTPFRFSGKARTNDTFDREGEEETKQFFEKHSNYKTLIAEMSKDEKESFEGWVSGDFMEGQQRRKFSEMTKLNQQDVRTYDKYLDRAILDRPIEVYRIGNPSDFNIDNVPVGGTVTTQTNMSTAAASQGLNQSTSSNAIHYTITIPKSTGAGMFIGHPQINHWGSSQREFMLNRDCDFILNDKKVIDGITYIHLRWIGRKSHRYD